MKICFICETPFQVLNSTNLAYHLFEKEKNIIDIYIGQQFKESDNITLRLEKENLFSNVYKYSTYRNDCRKLKKIGRIIGILYPEKRIHAMLNSKREECKGYYDVIFMSFPTHFSTAMSEINPMAKIIYYDDGIGSYGGNIADTMSKFNKRVYRFLGRTMQFMYPSELYVNNKELCKSTAAPIIRQMPQLQYASKEFLDMVKSIFDYENSKIYRKYRIIYLMQPNDNITKKMDEINLEVEKVLVNEKEKCLARPHPRQGNVKIFGMYMDDSGSMWELLCAEEISDNHVLVSMCSTAQIMPKILFGKEPYLVFTYLLFKSGLSERELKVIDETIENIKKIYSDSKKICVPRNLLELKQCLKLGEK